MEEEFVKRDPFYDILFEPVKIGPLTARNRFYQAPHCNGMGEHRPHMHAAMRAVKAEGGWAVVNTEHCSIHPSSDMLGEVVQTLWDNDDIPALTLMTDAVHEHGALAGIQLAHGSYYVTNRVTREVVMGPAAIPVSAYDPVQARAMNKKDIRQLLEWQKKASQRAIKAGFDIINVDANFSTMAFQFLSPRNQRADEYGGNVRNRARLLKELIEVTHEAAGPDCAVTVRMIVDEMIGSAGLVAGQDGLEVVAYLDDLVDLWDLLIGTWADDSPTSRFAPAEGHQEPLISLFKKITQKPIAGVGRFTSPDTMVAQINRGVLDMIGAARPSIADPFLPKKIEEGRVEDIRECIGCNICVSSHYTMSPLRCTQNPAMGEEWRRGWHPERIIGKGSDASVLVVGGGPAGLECARALGERGYPVTLAEATRELGGRIDRESRLPGLTVWARVKEWRIAQINKLSNIKIYRESLLGAKEILEYGFRHVVMATGARWRRDGIGRANFKPIPGADCGQIYTPDDIMDGTVPGGPVVIFDDDHYYMGSLIAEKLRSEGAEVTIVTPAADIAAWSYNTLELKRIYQRLSDLGVTLITHHNLRKVEPSGIIVAHMYTGQEKRLEAESAILVTARVPTDEVYQEVM
jgi:dimethylamine/trimethylamine dehydrogenase